MEIEPQLFGPGIAMMGTVQEWANTASLEDLRIVETKVHEIIAHRRWRIAGQLRGRGYSWGDIGKSLGISAQRAHKAYGPGGTSPYGPCRPGTAAATEPPRRSTR